MKRLKLMQSITGGIIKTNTEAITQKVEEDTLMLEVTTEGLPTIPIKELRQPPKTEGHTKETVVTRTKVTKEVELKTMVETMTRMIVNIVKTRPFLWRNVGNFKLRKPQ